MSEYFSPSVAAATESPRERKRRETRQRIAEVGQRLFLANGYDGTTLDAIAAGAGISRRTFFSYFKSKEDIMRFWQDVGSASLYADLLKISPAMSPLDGVRDVMVRHMAAYTNEQMSAIDRLMLSSAALIAGKQTYYARQEQEIFNTLCEVWRQPERRPSLRMVAMVAVGSMKLALQAWRDQSGPKKETAAALLHAAFERLKSELSCMRE